ncbi:MAG TPA: hypothetical protein VHT73_07495 [Thermodesulfobacteriota bacterium]|nr:hypothetical protein [Thermodesulfobacteriota bacterium]
MGDLQIREDLGFQRSFWTVERIGWVVVALILIAALLGLFGTGLFSRTKAGDRGGPLWLEYNRFGRFLSPSTLRVYIGRGKTEKVARIWFDKNYMKGIQIQQITPEPESVESVSDRLVYTFKLAKPNDPTEVTFHLKLEQIGSLSGKLGLVNGPAIRFTQFIYP